MDENNNKYKEALILACKELAAITRNQYGEDKDVVARAYFYRYVSRAEESINNKQHN